MKIDLEKNVRGFKVATFEDRNGVECNVQESSAATAAIWLGCTDHNAKRIRRAGEGWTEYHIPSDVLLTTRMHLDQEHVKALLPMLQNFAEHGVLTLLQDGEEYDPEKPEWRVDSISNTGCETFRELTQISGLTKAKAEAVAAVLNEGAGKYDRIYFDVRHKTARLWGGMEELV